MLVILKKDVKGTGKAGETVKVSDGFARNRLIPGGFAVEATDKNIKAAERDRAMKEKKDAEERADARALADELEKAPVSVKTRVGENGKLFGSITSMDIAAAIEAQTGKEIDRKKIVLPKPIKEIGTEEIEIKLHTDVTAKIKVKVEAE